MPAEFRRVMIRARLPRILDHLGRPPCREEINGKRTAGRRAQRAGGGHGPLGRPPRFSKCHLPRRIKMPIALIAAGLGIDVRQIIPDADHVRVCGVIQQIEDFLICALGGALQPLRLAVRIDGLLHDRQRAEQQIIGIAVAYLSVFRTAGSPECERDRCSAAYRSRRRRGRPATKRRVGTPFDAKTNTRVADCPCRPR